MKPTLTHTLIGILLVACTASLTADPKATIAVEKANPPQHVRVQVEYIEMPLTTMSALLDDTKATETDAILRNHVAQLIKSGKAKLLETQMLIARNGEKATTESIREFIYPTEYEPAELVKEIHTTANGTKIEGYNKDLATGPTPTAFETRNLGSTLEIEPSIGNHSRYIGLRFSPEIVYHTKNVTYSTWKDSHGNSDIVMPEIYTMRLSTAVTLLNGKAALVGAVSPRDDQGHVDYSRKLLVFVKASIIIVK